MIDEIEVAKGWILPFFPMRPARGPLLTKKVAKDILERMDDHTYIYQPKLNGDRVILAIVGGKVIACNRHYSWYSYQIANGSAFTAKLGDGTIFDGEVYKSQFFPFECLAREGHSFKANTAEQRALEAMHMCRLCGVPWLFKEPTRKWLMEGIDSRSHTGMFEGLVRKRANLPYTLMC